VPDKEPRPASPTSTSRDHGDIPTRERPGSSSLCGVPESQDVRDGLRGNNLPSSALPLVRWKPIAARQHPGHQGSRQSLPKAPESCLAGDTGTSGYPSCAKDDRVPADVVDLPGSYGTPATIDTSGDEHSTVVAYHAKSSHCKDDSNSESFISLTAPSTKRGTCCVPDNHTCLLADLARYRGTTEENGSAVGGQLLVSAFKDGEGYGLQPEETARLLQLVLQCTRPLDSDVGPRPLPTDDIRRSVFQLQVYQKANRTCSYLQRLMFIDLANRFRELNPEIQS
jgi:hypothetical protein